MPTCAYVPRIESMILPSAPALDPSTAFFDLDGQTVDALDLKTLLITCGINVPEEITPHFGSTHRLAPTSKPFACNCLLLLLPGGIPARLFHVGPGADSSLAVDAAGGPCSTFWGQSVTPVDFSPATRFYQHHQGFQTR